MLADVPLPRRPQEGIGYGMEEDIPIAVAQEALLIGNLHPSQDQLPPCHQAVDVIARPYPETDACLLLIRTSARARSSGVVILMLS